jgi:outer membrane protein insertion porin family
MAGCSPRVLAAVLLTLTAAAPASADDGDEERLEGLTVDAIEVKAPPRESPPQLLALSGLEPGQPFRAAEIRRAVKVLYQLGRFENVYVFGRRLGNLVELELRLTPRIHVRELTVLGADPLSDDEVEAALGLAVGADLDPGTLQRRQGALEAAFAELGHRDPAVGLALRRADLDGGVELVVRCDPGPVTTLRRLEVLGQSRLPRWRIHEMLGLDPGDALDLRLVRRGLQRLEAHYLRAGHLAAKVVGPEVTHESGDGLAPIADLRVVLEAGPKVEVRFVGHRRVPLRELEEATAELMRSDLEGAALAEAAERVLAVYERRGHWQARVEPQVRTSAGGDQKEIVFRIHEGPRGRVTELDFPGNEALDPELLRAKVHQIVEQALGGDSVAPLPDAEEIDRIVGSGSLPESAAVRPHPADPDPTRVYVERAYRGAADALADLYRAEGFQTVEISSPSIESAAEGREVSVAFPVRQGVQWRLGAVSFRGNDAVGALDLLEIADIDPGAPLSFYAVDAASRAIRDAYRERGHLYARVDEELREVLPRGALASGARVSTGGDAPVDLRQVCLRAEAASKPTCEVELVFVVHEGPEVKTRRVIVRGNTTTRLPLVKDELAMREGEVLLQRQMTGTQRNLARLGVFRRVSVRLMDEEREAETKDVLVDLVERKHSNFEVGAGVSTEEGVRAFMGYGHGNLFGTALRLQTNARVNIQTFLFLFNDNVRDFIAADPIEFQVGAGVQYPRILGLPRGFGLGGDVIVLRDNDPAFRENTRRITLTASYKGYEPMLAGRRRPLAFQLRASFDQSAIDCNESLVDGRVLCGADAADPSRRATQNTDYFGLLPGVSWDLRDDPLEPRLGVYFELQPELLIGFNQASPNHLNLKSKLNAYLPLGPELSLAASVVFWRIFRLGDGGTEMPVNRRFFAGGRATIRGFAEQTLFPIDRLGRADEVSPGGLLFAALKTELRFPIAGALAGTLFHDFGDLFDDPSAFSFAALTRQSIGIGLRYRTPIGPLLLDVAATRSRGEIVVLPHFAAVGSF